MVKAFGGQRESEGVVVPLIGVRDMPGGKGPCFDHVRKVGKHQGMTEVSWSNHPGGFAPVVAEDRLLLSPVKVRELQRALWAAVKQSQGRRFHALYDRIYRGDVLVEAWERVRKNKGAAGVDRVTVVAVEDYGVRDPSRSGPGTKLTNGLHSPWKRRRRQATRPHFHAYEASPTGIGS
jgi:RNA-directed DNA polymerase